MYPSIAFVSTYPPTRCGLATYTRSLREAITYNRSELGTLGIVRVRHANDSRDWEHPEVIAQLCPESPQSIREICGLLRSYDLVSIQHEFGIFEADKGECVIHLLDMLELPTVVTLHSVHDPPSLRDKRIIEKIVELADGVIVMSHHALLVLEKSYDVNLAKVHYIPHGAHCFTGRVPPFKTRPIVLTWGLNCPGKGIEWGIRALPALKELNPKPVYCVCGAEHPDISEEHGISYSQMLINLADSLGVSDMFEMRDTYHSLEELSRVIGEAEIVLIPYESHDQAISGVLVEAVGAGKPVIATKFPYAIEMLSDGSGILVPSRSSEAIAEALLVYFGDAKLRRSISKKVARKSSLFRWPTIGKKFDDLAKRIVKHNDVSQINASCHPSVLCGKKIFEKYADFEDIDDNYEGQIIACDGSSSSPVNWGRELVYCVALAIKFPKSLIRSFTVEANDPVYLCLESERQSGLNTELLYPAGAKPFSIWIDDVARQYCCSRADKSMIEKIVDILPRISPIALAGNLVQPPPATAVAKCVGDNFAEISQSSTSYSEFIIKSKAFILEYLLTVARNLFPDVGRVDKHRTFSSALGEDIINRTSTSILDIVAQKAENKALLGLPITNAVFTFQCPICAFQLGATLGTHCVSTDGSVQRKYRGYLFGKSLYSMRKVKCGTDRLYLNSHICLKDLLSNGIGLSGFAIYALLEPTILEHNTSGAFRNYRNGVPYLAYSGKKLSGVVTSEYCLLKTGQINPEVSISGFELYRIVKSWVKLGKFDEVRTLFLSPFAQEEHDWNIWMISDTEILRVEYENCYGS